MSSNYKSLGIRPIVNANATLTKLGGSLMPVEVRQVMQDAAQSFVDMHDLQQKVGGRLAEITRNEAAFVSCGAATGLLLATAACIQKASGATYENFPNPPETQNEVIVQRMHRNPYDYAVRQAGASLVQTLPHGCIASCIHRFVAALIHCWNHGFIVVLLHCFMCIDFSLLIL